MDVYRYYLCLLLVSPWGIILYDCIAFCIAKTLIQEKTFRLIPQISPLHASRKPYNLHSGILNIYTSQIHALKKCRYQQIYFKTTPNYKLFAICTPTRSCLYCIKFQTRDHNLTTKSIIHKNGFKLNDFSMKLSVRMVSFFPLCFLPKFRPLNW